MTAIMRYVLVIMTSIIVVAALTLILTSSTGEAEKTAINNINLSLGE